MANPGNRISNPLIVEKKMIPNGYTFPPDYAPSDAMLSEVSLDFDGDLGGLSKGPRIERDRLHPVWLLVALAILIMLILANSTYGLGFIGGTIIGAVCSKIYLR